MSWHLTDRMNGEPNQWGGAGFMHDASGVRQSEDHIIGSRHGPSFNTAQDLARFIVSNRFKSEPLVNQESPVLA